MLGALLLVALVAGCGGTKDRMARTASDRLTPPELGTCRVLAPDDVEAATNESLAVGCGKDHTAETFAIGSFPSRFKATGYHAPELGRYVYSVCNKAFVRFLGGDESMAMRSLTSWAWFGPSKAGWAKQARWYRCDVVGGLATATSYRPLPDTAKGLLSARPPEHWMMCARGATVVDSAKVPCASAHDWRAVTTIKLGQPKDPYPGDRIAQIRSQQYCSDSVGAWLNYPATNYDYGVTVFHRAEWKAGNRRSICWAKTDR